MELEYAKIEKAVRTVFDEYMLSENVEMASKWYDGELILRPGNTSLQEKVIPIETFFHKIVMLREQLRVLEQKINNAPELDDIKRAEWHKYISRIYGTLTTFNVLFADDEDKFKGQSGSK
jgi:hypothetical protein